ncbi:hypothetical protein [Mycoplasma simbae]|uniref:hypothetical protein n=1 Tax=Mycoplasma simbae TaxID=36744 RepID=UPI0004956503|nr:hypothetical protein [Mycoplasma simbae]
MSQEQRKDETLMLIAKIFIIITMILTFWLVFPLVIGFLVLNKIKKGFLDKNDRIVWGVITLLTLSVVSGVLILVSE